LITIQKKKHIPSSQIFQAEEHERPTTPLEHLQEFLLQPEEAAETEMPLNRNFTPNLQKQSKKQKKNTKRIKYQPLYQHKPQNKTIKKKHVSTKNQNFLSRTQTTTLTNTRIPP
jgi:hypothetical protein